MIDPTALRVLAKHYRPRAGGTGPSWLSFIDQTRDSLWSVDLFRCGSIVLRSYWVLVVMDQFTRRLVGFSVCGDAVTGSDLCRMFNGAIRGQDAPRHVSADHDPLFESHRWTANLQILEIDEIKTVPHVPLSHTFVERLIGTMRREFLEPGAVLECARSGTEAWRVPGLLQRGTLPRDIERPHAGAHPAG